MLGAEQALQRALGGGDDYELCFTVPDARLREAQALLAGQPTPTRCIGRLSAQEVTWRLQRAGAVMEFSHAGFRPLRPLSPARPGTASQPQSPAVRILLRVSSDHARSLQRSDVPMATLLQTEPRPRTRIPEKIGKYVIVNEVGRGSTGIVYLSHDPYYGRDVAIKVYNLDAGGDEEKARIARKMFLSEAHMVGMLQHPHILPIYDAGEEGDYCYIVTEHVHGARTLAAYCKPDNLLRIDDVVEIVYKCARALHYAHSRGVIHRDIKPSNIMLTQDSDVRIIDFGIALVADSDISRIEGIAGSPSYMSPEQVQSLELTNRSDIYSLGAVMYELLTGARPVQGLEPREAAAPDRLRHAGADPHAARRHPRGDRAGLRDRADEAARAPLQDRAGLRR